MRVITMYPIGIEIDLTAKLISIVESVFANYTFKNWLFKIDSEQDKTQGDAEETLLLLLALLYDELGLYADAVNLQNYNYFKRVANEAIMRNELVGGVIMFALDDEMTNRFKTFIKNGVNIATLQSLASVTNKWNKIGGDNLKQLEEMVAEEKAKLERKLALVSRNGIGELNSELTEERAKFAQSTQYKWRGMLDEVERVLHLNREGVIFNYSVPPSDGHPGEPPNCRCHAEPIFKKQVN